MGDENPILTLGDYSRPIHEGYRNTTELPEGNNVVPLRSDAIWSVQNKCSFYRLWSENPNQHLKDFLKLMDSLDLDIANKERARLQDLALYDNESWNDPRDFAKPVKAISLPQDVPSTSDHCLIELKNQVQRFMEAHLAPKQLIQVNKITSSCEICRGPHDTQYYMENPEQAFVKYASSKHHGSNDFASTNYPTKEELQGKGIKIPSKLLSLKYLSRSSLAEQNRNPSSPKHVYFVNSIIILNKEDEAKEEESMKSSATEYKDHEMRVESKEEFEEETKKKSKKKKRKITQNILTLSPL
ncbi:hypothetical protein Tco_0991271 [Tanacetum coccineum]|uniref:MAK10-like protein n=1 Tax=Tanacetum coccineum TaxID=301880 RepID=A0ABQ5F0H9_9ASTR